MNKRHQGRLIVLVATMTCLLGLAAYGQQDGKAGKKEFTFHGKVEKVDAGAKTLAVNNEAIPGWMNSMTMTYTVDEPDVLRSIKAGDQITAKVYEGDFKTLYEMKVVPLQGGKSEKKDAPKK
jgi:Cu/Ag efflux protein CusF